MGTGYPANYSKTLALSFLFIPLPLKASYVAQPLNGSLTYSYLTALTLFTYMEPNISLRD